MTLINLHLQILDERFYAVSLKFFYFKEDKILWIKIVQNGIFCGKRKKKKILKKVLTFVFLWSILSKLSQETLLKYSDNQYNRHLE